MADSRKKNLNRNQRQKIKIDKLHIEIFRYKLEVEELRVRLIKNEDTKYRYQDLFYKYKNATLIQRIKFLFKGEL